MQSTVLDYVQDAIEAVASTPTGTIPVRQGVPQEGMPQDIGQYPLCVLTVRDIEPEHVTAGTGGTVFERYAVIITLYLAPKNAAHNVVVARAKLFPSRLRAKFTPDWRLGGACFNSDLRGPANNIELTPSGKAVYQEADQFPLQQWALMVTENTTAGAAALV